MEPDKAPFFVTVSCHRSLRLPALVNENEAAID